MSIPRRHHYVPQAYLARFGGDDQVRVRRRQPAKTHLAHVRNIAAETDFYTVTEADGSSSVVVERLLGEVERDGIRTLRTIDETAEPPPVGSEDRELLALYLAVQAVRTPRRRAEIVFGRRVTAYADGREVDRDLMSEYLARRHLGRTPSTNESFAALTWYQAARDEFGDDLCHDTAVAVPLARVDRLLPYVLDRHWRLEIGRKPNFLTSDAPLVLWRHPSPLDVRGGIGLANAEEIRFPVGPDRQLVLVPGRGSSVEEVNPRRVSDCNQILADTCDRVVVGHPDRHAQLDKVELTTQGPILRFELLSGRGRTPEGRTSDVLHLWTTPR
jgi:hypothetical protein